MNVLKRQKDLVVKIGGTIAKAVPWSGFSSAARLYIAFGTKHQHESSVGQQPLASDVVKRANGLKANASGTALVGQ